MNRSPDFHGWERAMERANLAFHDGAADARVHYARALRHARALLAEVAAIAVDEADVDMLDAAIAACVVSHHNVAGLHRRYGGTEAAKRHYRHAHRTVCGLSGDPALCQPLRTIAARHANRTLGELIAFQHACGHCPRIASTRH